MNDPNGMVYFHGVYHLFYQHYPGGTTWGPMHWGHAVSRDLAHWTREPIALFPDSLGYIFSGSAVADSNNTSGLGSKEHIPLVAIFTHHDPAAATTRNDYQNQSLAYSIDEGKTWEKYEHNPVLRNPGIADFRDPKVMWYAPDKKWVMTLATKDRISFYSSPNLKDWSKESEFGATVGAHGGVWECPDLFTLSNNGKKVWVLIVNLNPGGPNGGSATQYFIGNFDGHTFTPASTDTKWLDYGPDEYAGVTWGNTGQRKIFLGWMSNWLYANEVPTVSWRNAMTIPRELVLKKEGGRWLIASQPVHELSVLSENKVTEKSIPIKGRKDWHDLHLPCRLDLDIQQLHDLSLILSNEKGEQITVGFDSATNRYYIDRTHSGKVDFQKDFSGVHVAPRLTDRPQAHLTLVIDVASVELFADEGLTTMTEIFFPEKPYTELSIRSPRKTMIRTFSKTNLRSIWQ